MCGEMAGDPDYTRVLLGMGLREFSMDPAAILEVKRQVRLSDVSRLRSQVDGLMRVSEPDQLRKLVARMNA